MAQYKALGIKFTFDDGAKRSYRQAKAIAAGAFIFTLFVSLDILITATPMAAKLLSVVPVPALWFFLAMYIVARKVGRDSTTNP